MSGMYGTILGAKVKHTEDVVNGVARCGQSRK